MHADFIHNRFCSSFAARPGPSSRFLASPRFFPLSSSSDLAPSAPSFSPARLRVPETRLADLDSLAPPAGFQPGSASTLEDLSAAAPTQVLLASLLAQRVLPGPPFTHPMLWWAEVRLGPGDSDA